MPDAPPKARAIFISYRRDDAGGEAGRLFDDLTRAFGNDTVFMDVAGIAPGKDFRKSIDENVAECGVLLAVIGPQWLTMANSAGVPRLENPNDFVRLEIASALARNIPVIPVLVHNAAMPAAEALPGNLQDFAFRNGVELTLPRWNSDVALLIAALKNYVHVAPATAAEPVHATIPVRLPPPNPPPGPRAKASLNQILGPIAAAIIIAALILIGLVVILYNMGKNSPTPSPAPITQGPVATNPETQPSTSSLTQTEAHPARTVPSGPFPSPSANSSEFNDQPARAPSARNESPQDGDHGLNQYQVSLPYNVVGIYDDGRTFSPSTGIDGFGHAYHPFTRLIAPGTSDMTLSDGTTFTVGPLNVRNVLRCSPMRYSINLPRQSYSTIHILAASVHGTQFFQPFTVAYATSFTQNFAQNISDWTAVDAPRLPGERPAILQPYVNTAVGTPQNGRVAVYEYQIGLNPALPLRALTLPLNDSVVVLAVTLVP